MPLTGDQRRRRRDQLMADAARHVEALDRIAAELREVCGPATYAPLAPDRWTAEGLAWAVRNRVVPFNVGPGPEPRLLSEGQWRALTAREA